MSPCSREILLLSLRNSTADIVIQVSNKQQSSETLEFGTYNPRKVFWKGNEWQMPASRNFSYSLSTVLLASYLL